AAITKGEVESANIVDREQIIQLILKPGEAINGSTKVEASYVSGQEPILVDLLTANQPPKEWDVTVPKTNIFINTTSTRVAFKSLTPARPKSMTSLLIKRKLAARQTRVLLTT
ncbi:MAG: hypothetical protein EB120_05685, partial [Proteobacteria bacterium]|nr:hypothetical protein [Pseudomonadota bacterium]